MSMHACVKDDMLIVSFFLMKNIPLEPRDRIVMEDVANVELAFVTWLIVGVLVDV